MGHPGKDTSIWLARQRIYWPGLENDFNMTIEACGRCIGRKTPVKHSAKLTQIKTSRPMHLVCIDFFKHEMSKVGMENVLVITDHFTRYAQAIQLKNQSAQTTANFIVLIVFPSSYIVIRVVFLSHILLKKCASLPMFIRLGLGPTTIWAMWQPLL